MSDMVNQGPSSTWVFIDEHPDSMNDAGFFNPQTRTAPVDVPASYHNAAGGLAFADGHSEINKWKGIFKQKRAQQVIYNTTFAWSKVDPRDPDLIYLHDMGGLKGTTKLWK
jgi:hypothetical protein